MKFKELKGLPVEELKSKLMDLRRDLVKERAQVATGTVSKNPSKIKNAKKNIARILMILAEKEVVKKA